MIDSYQEKYARYYDLIYGDKDYEKECDFIEEILRKYARAPVENILEGGCGAGGHAIPMSRRGYSITGIDISEPMIRTAKSKARKAKQRIDFQVNDLRQFDLGRKFDACLCMFAALGYITDTGELLKTFTNIRQHLKKDSLLVFDVWNGLAVLRILPSTRVKSIADKEVSLFRIATPELDAVNHQCRVKYNLFITQKDKSIQRVDETHTVRFFFPLELSHYLSETGFRVVKMCPFLDLEGNLDENVWNMTVVARAV